MAVLHTVAVKATNPGGRLFDGISQNETRVNGEFGFLGAYADNATYGVKDGQTQIKVFTVPANTTQGNANFGRMPVVIMQPEMMYDDSRKSLLKLSLMEIPSQTPFTCVPLEEGDKFDITADALFKNGGAPAEGADFDVAKCYTLVDGQSHLRLTGNGLAPVQNGQVYFEIVKVKDAHARSARIGGTFQNDNYKLYTLEVKVVRN